MSQFKREKIDDLIRDIQPKGHTFKFYMNSNIEPYKFLDLNQGIDEVPILLEELERGYGFSYDIVDISFLLN